MTTSNQASEVLRRVNLIITTAVMKKALLPPGEDDALLDDQLWCATRLRTALKDAEWQKIKTAPKTGDRVLIGWLDADGVWQTRAAYWDAEFEITGHQARTCKTLYRAAWTDGCVESFGYEETKSYEPTHWLPLPKPPVESPTTGIKE